MEREKELIDTFSLSFQINYAKGIYDERELTLSFSEVSDDVCL